VKPPELLKLLDEIYRDKSALRARHVAGARLVGNYDFNNTYQYVINREDVHLAWLRDAIADLGGAPQDAADGDIKGSGKDAQQTILRDDVAQVDAFVAKWKPRVESISHARNRTMLRLMLGETLEQKRFFEQALAGRSDMLGRRADGAGTKGTVLPTRWIS
jgi:hypothetical protein